MGWPAGYCILYKDILGDVDTRLINFCLSLCLYQFAFHRKTGASISIKFLRSLLTCQGNSVIFQLLDEANELHLFIHSQRDC